MATVAVHVPKDNLPAMTGAELQSMREYLGLSIDWLAEQLTLNKRRMLRMEEGKERIPTVLVSLIDDIYEETNQMVDELSGHYRRKVKATQNDVVVATYRTDREYDAAGGKYPSRWHRMVMARVAHAVPGLVITHAVAEADAEAL